MTPARCASKDADLPFWRLVLVPLALLQGSCCLKARGVRLPTRFLLSETRNRIGPSDAYQPNSHTPRLLLGSWPAPQSPTCRRRRAQVPLGSRRQQVGCLPLGRFSGHSCCSCPSQPAATDTLAAHGCCLASCGRPRRAPPPGAARSPPFRRRRCRLAAPAPPAANPAVAYPAAADRYAMPPPVVAPEDREAYEGRPLVAGLHIPGGQWPGS